MMLLYKAWLESRTRFVLSFLAMAGLTGVFVFFNHDVRNVMTDHDVSYTEYIWKGVFRAAFHENSQVSQLQLELSILSVARGMSLPTY